MYTDEQFDYDVAVVGGGPAGLTSALYTTRLGMDTVVVNRGGGRAAMMTDTHNVIGVTEDVSGNEFLQTAREQVEDYGGTYRRGFVESVEPLTDTDGFEVTTDDGDLTVKRVVLATGFADERPDPPLPRTGKGLHWCLHCDAFMFVGEPVFVMGTGEAAAHVAMIMLNYTDDVDILTRGEAVEWSEDTQTMLDNHPVEVVDTELSGKRTDDDGWLEAYEFEDGSRPRGQSRTSRCLPSRRSCLPPRSVTRATPPGRARSRTTNPRPPRTTTDSCNWRKYSPTRVGECFPDRLVTSRRCLRITPQENLSF